MRQVLRRLAGGPFGGDGERRVLVLQGELAVWTRWADGRRVAVQVERLDTDASAACVCPWPVAGETFVDVVADSPLDDIEQVQASGTVAGSGVRAPGRLARHALARRLTRRHPDAMVCMAPRGTLPLLATLLHAELPDDWRHRLETLQRGPVTIVALHSAIRLREPLAEERTGDVLQVTRGAGAERHLLLRSGCPAFTRVVRAGGTRDPSPGSSVALDETLAHLAESHGDIEPRLRRYPDVSGTDDVVDAYHLAALALGARDRAGAGVPFGLLEKRRHHGELRRLHAATALTAAIAGLTVLASAVHGIDSARRRARAVAAGEALSLHVERLAESIAGRHPTPALADASLTLLERRERAGAPEADDVLALLAGVLTTHPDIRLDRLDWSTPEPEDATDDGRPGSAASQPLRRVRGADDIGEPPFAWLEMTGRVDAAGALSVRERQRRFEAFVAALESDHRITALGVELSPASAAATGDGGTGAARRVDYVLRLRYAKRS